MKATNAFFFFLVAHRRYQQSGCALSGGTRSMYIHMNMDTSPLQQKDDIVMRLRLENGNRATLGRTVNNINSARIHFWVIGRSIPPGPYGLKPPAKYAMRRSIF